MVTVICYFLIVIHMVITIKKTKLSDRQAEIKDLNFKKTMEE